MPKKRKWAVDIEVDGLHGVQRVKGSGTYQAAQKRLSFTSSFYSDREGSETFAVGGRKKISFTLSTCIPESNPKSEFHQDDFQKIIDNEAQTVVRKLITKLHNSSESGPDVPEGGVVGLLSLSVFFSIPFCFNPHDWLCLRAT